MARSDCQFKFRMPREVRDRLEASAIANERTMNAEIASILKAALFPREEGFAQLERKLAEAMAIVRLAQKEGKDG